MSFPSFKPYTDELIVKVLDESVGAPAVCCTQLSWSGQEFWRQDKTTLVRLWVDIIQPSIQTSTVFHHYSCREHNGVLGASLQKNWAWFPCRLNEIFILNFGGDEACGWNHHPRKLVECVWFVGRLHQRSAGTQYKRPRRCLILVLIITQNVLGVIRCTEEQFSITAVFVCVRVCV